MCIVELINTVQAWHASSWSLTCMYISHSTTHKLTLKLRDILYKYSLKFDTIKRQTKGIWTWSRCTFAHLYSHCSSIIHSQNLTIYTLSSNMHDYSIMPTPLPVTMLILDDSGKPQNAFSTVILNGLVLQYPCMASTALLLYGCG